MKSVVNVGIIGFGTVGAGAVKILQRNRESIRRKVGCDIDIIKIADLDIASPRGVQVDASMLTTDAAQIIENPDIDIVVETIGGVQPAGDFIRTSLRNGKHVVTANKELIAKESYDPQYGARPIKRYLQKHVENELASMIIRGDLLDGGSVTIDSDGTNLTFKA